MNSIRIHLTSDIKLQQMFVINLELLEVFMLVSLT